MSTAQVPPTPENVASFLTSADNSFHEGLNGWPSLTAKGSVVEIKVTPTGDDGAEDEGNAVDFRAVVIEGDETPIVLECPAELGLSWHDGEDLLTLDDTGIIRLHPQGADEWDLSAAEAREMAAHLAAMADVVETTFPRQQLQNAARSYTREGLDIWEVSDEGGHVIALGHVDKHWMASAILAFSETNHDEPLTKVWLTDIRHTTGRIENTPDGRFDFACHTGEGLDFKVTEWRLGSGEADTRG